MPKIRYEVVEPTVVGERLKIARLSSILDRKKVAAILEHPNGRPVTATMVRHWEMGKANLPVWAAVQLCNIYGLGISNLTRKIV